MLGLVSWGSLGKVEELRGAAAAGLKAVCWMLTSSDDLPSLDMDTAAFAIEAD